MSLRLVIQFEAKPGKGGELAKLFDERCLDMRKDPGCEQMQIYQDFSNPDKFVVIELWASSADLEGHVLLNKGRNRQPPLTDLLANGWGSREDYEYKLAR